MLCCVGGDQALSRGLEPRLVLQSSSLQPEKAQSK